MPDRVEIPELRSSHAKWFTLPSGARQVELSLKWPVHYQDATGTWQDIDTTLLPDAGDAEFDLSCTKHSFSAVRLAKRSPQPVRVERGGCRLTLRAQNVANVKGVASANKLTFVDAWTAADLAWLVVPEGLRKLITLKSPLAPSSYSFLAKLDNLDLLANQDGSLYAWAGPFPVFELARPWVHDANGIPGPATLTLRVEGDKTFIDLLLDPAWLADPARAFPVVLDPTVIQPDAAAGKDTWVDESNPASNNGSHAELWAGDDTPDRRRSFIEFALAAYAGGVATAALLELYFQTEQNTTDRSIGMHKITTPWAEGTVTWNAQPTYDAGATVSATAATPATWVGWNILSLLNQWLAGTVTNYGLAVVNASETSGLSGKAFYSSDYGTESLRPKLTLTFPTPTATGTYPTGTLVAPGAVTNDLSPLVTWSTTGDPQTKYEVHLTTASGTQTILDTGEVTSATKQHQCANGLLRYGITYRWQVRVKSAFSDWSAFSAWQYFAPVMSAPVGLAATPHAADAHIDLAWTAHAGEGLSGYHLWRKPHDAADSEYRRQDTTLLTGTSFTDDATGSGVLYAYAVTAAPAYVYESPMCVHVDGTVSFAGFRLGTLTVHLARPARPTRTRIVTRKRRTDATSRITDRGYGERELDLLLAFQSFAEEAAICALFDVPGAVVGYRDELGQALRGQLVGDIDSDGYKVRANAGLLDLTLLEVTPDAT